MGCGDRTRTAEHVQHTSAVDGDFFSRLFADGKFVLSGNGDKTLRLWDAATGRALKTFMGHLAPVTSVAFSSDGKLALSGSLDETLKLWDVASGRVLKTLLGHDVGVTSVALSPDARLAASGDDGTVRAELMARSTRMMSGFSRRYLGNASEKLDAVRTSLMPASANRR